MKKKIKILAEGSQACGSIMKASATRPSPWSLKFEVQSQKMKKKNQNWISCEPSLGLRYEALSNETINNTLRFEVQSQWTKKIIKISAHVNQAWGSVMKVSATRPPTSSLRFEVQSQRMKRKIKILAHVSQALGSNINKQVVVWSSITKNIREIQNFNSYKPSLKLWFEGPGNETFNK
jgi:predicted RNA binding protein with dsRBD fold (UPF0201 family)